MMRHESGLARRMGFTGLLPNLSKIHTRRRFTNTTLHA